MDSQQHIQFVCGVLVFNASNQVLLVKPRIHPRLSASIGNNEFWTRPFFPLSFGEYACVTAAQFMHSYFGLGVEFNDTSADYFQEDIDPTEGIHRAFLEYFGQRRTGKLAIRDRDFWVNARWFTPTKLPECTCSFAKTAIARWQLINLRSKKQ